MLLKKLNQKLNVLPILSNNPVNGFSTISIVAQDNFYFFLHRDLQLIQHIY